MDRESQELRAHSQTWPPGLHAAGARSLVLDRGYYGLIGLEQRVRTYSRAGTTLLVLVVCAFSLGYGLTEWACEADRKASARDPGSPGVAAVAAVAAQAEPQSAREPASIQADEVSSGSAGVSRARVAHGAYAKRAAAPRPVARAAREPVPAEPAESPAAVAEAEPLSMERLQRVADALAPEVPASPPQLAAAADTAEEMRKQLAAAPADSSAIDKPVQVTAAKTPVAVVQPHVTAPPAMPKAAAIEALVVEGALTQGVVNRGVSRLLPQYERCGEFADSALQRMKLSTVIDEAGHGRRILVDGLSKPSLRRCLEQATAHLSVPAPDTGIARARWTVRFASKHP